MYECNCNNELINYHKNMGIIPSGMIHPNDLVYLGWKGPSLGWVIPRMGRLGWKTNPQMNTSTSSRDLFTRIRSILGWAWDEYFCILLESKFLHGQAEDMACKAPGWDAFGMAQCDTELSQISLTGGKNNSSSQLHPRVEQTLGWNTPTLGWFIPSSQD